MANPINNLFGQYTQGLQKMVANPNSLGPVAPIPDGARLGPNEKTMKMLKAEKAAKERAIMDQWKNRENKLAAARQAETDRIDNIDVRKQHIYDQDRPTGPVQSLQADANQNFPHIAPQSMQDFELYGGIEPFAENNIPGAVNIPMTGAGISEGQGPVGPGNAPTGRSGPPGAPTMPQQQQLDPLTGQALALDPQQAAAQQAQMAAVYDQARLTQEAARNDRLNPFGIGSGYEDLQRPRTR